MFRIYDGRDYFYQWDIDRKIIVEDETITEVHFCNRTDDCSLICEVYSEGNLRVANVPNILLQGNWRINVYAYDGSCTKHATKFEVKSRTKPADYIYTETELKNYDDLVARIEAIENGSGASIDLSDYATKDYVNAAIGNIEIPEGGADVDLSEYATKEYVDNAIDNVSVSDEQVASAVSDWLTDNPEATTTVVDGSITQEKLSDALVEKLGLEPNHNLREVKLTLHNAQYNSFWAGTDTGSSTSTELFETPQYIRIVNNHSCDIQNAGVRFADINDYENATFLVEDNLSSYHQAGYFAETIPVGEERTIPTYEWGSNSKKYMQIRYQPGTWSNAWKNIEIYAIYDDLKPSYNAPNDAESKEMFLADLPMKWIVSAPSEASWAGVYCAVPYYPDFTYHIRGGYYPNILINTIDVFGLYDDISVFDTVKPSILHKSLNVYRLKTQFGTTTQYDTSVNAGKDKNYAWAYFKTPKEEEHTGLKWLLFQFNYNSTYKGQDLTEEIVKNMLDEWCAKDVGYDYISRWQNKDLPRKPTTQLRILNPNLNDGGTMYQAFNTLNVYHPMNKAKWVLFGDSLTDNYGGHDKSSNYFASKIANEFNMELDNRAKGGSNIYKGGSGNYVNVSGIIVLDEYLAEIEAGTTEQADYITVAFGTNSYKGQIGTNEDTSENYTASVFGATKYFIEKIREKVPNAVLGFVLSPRQKWPSNADPNGSRDLDNAREAIRTVCEEYGVPYIDMSKESGITVDMLPDGIHISNEQSQKLYYHAMRRFMMGL